MDRVLYRLQDEVTPEFILSRVPEKDMYQRYLGFVPRFGVKFCNPLREDRRPTCSFTTVRGKLVFRDWSEQLYMDVFDVVQRRFGVDFRRALDIVAADFGLDAADPPPPTLPLPSAPPRRAKPRFDVQVQPLTPTDAGYLAQFGITPEIARRFNAFSVKSLHVDGRPRYRYSSFDPALGYYFGLNSRGRQKWKIYYYYRVHARFLCNTSRSNGWQQLPAEGPVVVLTKSQKDVMSLARLGVPACGTQGESTLPWPEMIDELRLRFRHLVSLYDFDRTGCRAAAALRRRYGIPAWMLTDGRFGSADHGAKDISDYIKAHGLPAARTLTRNALTSLFHGTSSIARNSRLPASLQSLQPAQGHLLEGPP